MRPESEYLEALRLVDAGLNDSEVSRRLGIPRSTVRGWREGRDNPLGGRSLGHGPFGGQAGRTMCPVCGDHTAGDLWESAYAYLLGAYLGDGYISRSPKGVYALRVTCDLKYPGIIDEVAAAMVIVRARDKVNLVPSIGCLDVKAYWKHWRCLFPQAGPGRKHDRRIELTEWQKRIVDAYPKDLLRGLIHSDGNRHVNEVARALKGGVKRYRYPRYMFTNRSRDIRKVFTDALDLLGVHWTRTGPWVVAVSRRQDVAFLDTFIGPKS